jgi:hypothetical protein
VNCYKIFLRKVTIEFLKVLDLNYLKDVKIGYTLVIGVNKGQLYVGLYFFSISLIRSKSLPPN